MHARSLALSLPWDVEIDNEAGVGEAEVVRALRPYLEAASKTTRG
jgi:hypothetical protein